MLGFSLHLTASFGTRASSKIRFRSERIGEMAVARTNDEPEAVSPDEADMSRTQEEMRALLEHRNRQIEAIRRTSDALFSHPSVDAIVKATMEIALDVLRADAGTLFLHDPQSDTLIARYVIGGAGERFVGTAVPSTQGIAGTVFRTHEPLLTGDVRERGDFNPAVDQETGYETHSMMTVPVKRAGGNPVGVMQVLNARVPFTQLDLEVLEVLCDQAAMGIEHVRLAEEARRAQIVHVIGDISHDIKNMLTPILTGVWTLEPMLARLFADLDAARTRCPKREALEIARATDAVRNDYRWVLEGVVGAAEQVQARTREIADAVKGELSPPFFERVDMGEPCRAVVDTLRSVADRAGVSLLLDLDPELPPVECDRKLIVNALYNLVNNAIPFTPAGGSVTVRTRRPAEGDGGNETFTVEVEDTGRGMPEHVRERILSGDPISTTVSGTGLGTRIVLGVVRRHHGTLDITSEAGVGTTFTLRLPVRHRESVSLEAEG
jgi:signal transduction histidine kinase